MKALRSLVDKIKPNFEKGGKLEKFWVVFDGLETFLFVPKHANHNGVHVRDGIDLKRTMFTVIIAMIPALLFGMWNVGFQHYAAYGETSTLMDNLIFGAIKVLPIIIVSYGVGLGIEFLFAGMRGHSINEGYLVTGMLIPLILPVTVPLWMVAFASAFTVIIGKEVFGGTGFNIMNPALLARAFLFFAFPAYMSGEIWVAMDADKTLVDGFSGATSLVYFDEGLSSMNENISATDMFFGTIKGSIGETSTLAILLGGLYLIYTGVGSWRIMTAVFAGGYLMGLLFNLLAGSAYPAMEVPAHYHLLMGGFAFGAVFMATDPVSAAQTNRGKWMYGLAIGGFTVILRVFNPAYPEAMMLSILFFNVFAPLIDHIVIQRHIKTRMKSAYQ
ncbi:MAG: NADH:ubiquinone reductase (Na(+)-transporting) subunit B [Saprospiraceae bacterium]|nr:NADH:ubiquinone reductase (Na(+)-transporting) subunit B [Saprospiraceae bacterium]